MWLRVVRFGLGAGCAPTLHPAFEQRFGFPLVEVWGMTETGRFLADNHEPRMITTRAFGRAHGDLQACIADEAGNAVPDGTHGELVVRTAGDDPRRRSSAAIWTTRQRPRRLGAAGGFTSATSPS